MRFTALAVGVAALFVADIANAQGSCPGASVSQPPFSRTFTSNATRGYFFQAPVAFTIDALNVPNEPGNAEQAVEVYLDSAPPPAFSATSNPPIAFGAYNQPTGTPISTGGILVAPGQWVIVIGATNPTGSTAMSNSYAGSGVQSVDIGGIPVDISRCGTQTSIAASPGPNPIFSEVNGSVSRIEMCVTITGTTPPALVGAVEPTPFANPLTGDDATFFDGDFMRWNYNDISGGNTGRFGATVLNVGFGGAPAVGVTTQIPGFNQLWALSTPTGLGTVYGPFIVGSTDQIVFVPPGLFGNGDVVRIQALILDRNAAGTLPVTPMFNTISYTYTPPPPTCTIEESFDTTATGLGNYPVGWSNGGGVREWRVDDLGTPSSGTGPTSAFTGANYMYTETSGAAGGDQFILNTDTYTDQTVTQASFYLSRIGAGMGTLEVFYNDGVNPPTSLGTWTGPNGAQSQGGEEWQLITLPFTPSASYSFQFVYTHGSSFTGDCSIDRFCLGN